LLHKIADGLAIGACDFILNIFVFEKKKISNCIKFHLIAYSESLSLGVSTSLAILIHEIPHEIGDYAVLEESGFNLITILILNLITSFSSLISFFIIASVSPNKDARQWIFSIIAGVFLYIAMVVMIPPIKKTAFKKHKENNNKRDILSILVVIGMFLLGFTIMLLLAIFEDDIRVPLTQSCS
jgi:zinc transporter ZupT